MTYPFWDDYEFKTFSSLVLRNGGQDWSAARIRDSFISRLVEGMYLDNSATRPVVVYINGQYNGLYDFNEDLNSEFLVTHYGIDGDTVDFIRRNEAVIKGSNKDIRRRIAASARTATLQTTRILPSTANGSISSTLRTTILRQRTFANTDMFNPEVLAHAGFIS